MKKYILPLLFGLQAIILVLCLTGFTLIKGALLNYPPKPQAACGNPLPGEKAIFTGDFEDEQLSLAWRNGEKIFKSNCVTCHSLERKLTGPRLGYLCDTYGPEDRDWLKSWISNSPRMIFVDKDPRAIALWEANNKAAMNAFPNFSDQQLDDLLFYLSPECFGD